MPRASYEMSKYAALTALVQAPVDVVRAPQGSPLQHRWAPNREDYRVPLHGPVLARLRIDNLVDYVDADEDMVFRHVHGPRIRLTSYGRAEQARMAAAIHERYGL
jgi:hypothetical protein